MAAQGRYEHVMVPVPEELVPEVVNYLRWGSGSPPGDWSPDSLVRLLDELDSQARRLLLRVAEAADEGDILTVTDAARAAGCTEREVLGLVLELNDAVRTETGIALVLATSMLLDTPETGPRAWSINMPTVVARFILEAVGRRAGG